ncbi:HEAT repeat domain-containing protein [Parasulfitobacter algicola]|uniref:HEAT repeat domain-containing protein n=1 Tax=Parasulfitobacter algicola TaxID=2614809 RepID=A0ABX2ISX1_9RHOB|nr:HEAT repeat domain-containing protein [Sulfitobacter algicola]NSX55650.1 HEAT repeat domain-containing protein [Sulfitobacter algicola]
MSAVSSITLAKPSPTGSLDALSLISRHLASDNAVIRCAAARALGALNDPRAASMLVDALMDEDPDVRDDAMMALRRCAAPEHAQTILESLLGDPVKDVKIAAIQVLAKLNAVIAIPVLRGLALDRMEDKIAWEDQAGMWDDWLEVQIAAIAALGKMQDRGAVEPILAATQDELGQELEDVAFAALAQIPETGTAALLGIVRHPSDKTRRFALNALLNAKLSVLGPMIDVLANDVSPQIRILSLRACSADHGCVEQLGQDSDPQVRFATLDRFGAQRPDLALAGLADTSEAVRALALSLVSEHPEPPKDLFSNAAAWLAGARSELAIACITAMAKLDAPRAAPVLIDISGKPEQQAELRIAAIAALSASSDPDVIQHMAAMVHNPDRQLRAAALKALARVIQRDDQLAPMAEDAIIAAINHISADNDVIPMAVQGGQGDLGATRVEGPTDPRIMITRDGDIVAENPDAESIVVKPDFPRSTLQHLQDQNAPGQGDTPKIPQGRRRVAIAGPDNFATDLRITAIGIAASIKSTGLAKAILECVDDPHPDVRTAVYRAGLQLVDHHILKQPQRRAFAKGLKDTQPQVRADALRMLLKTGDVDQGIIKLSADPDPIVRMICVQSYAVDQTCQLLDALHDSAEIVRRAALHRIMAIQSRFAMSKAIQIAFDMGETAGLGSVINAEQDARHLCLEILARPNTSSHDVLSILIAFGPR